MSAISDYEKDILMKKLFGEINMTWLKVIIFAVIAGAYTALMALLPAVEHTSFKDIAISFEWWILFGVIIIMNSKSPLDSALKCFVFFLISQPLVYLIQVPFAGWGIMGYYRNWVLWTIATLPMGYIGHFLKKDKWWGLIILTPVLAFLGISHYSIFLAETMSWFPHHLLSAVFCLVTLIIYPLFIFKDKKVKIAGIIISAVIIIIGTAMAVMADHSFYNTTLFSSSEGGPEYFDDTYSVSLEDESYGTVHIEYEDAIEAYAVFAEFNKPGPTKLILTAPDGAEKIYSLNIEKDTYSIKRIK